MIKKIIFIGLTVMVLFPLSVSGFDHEHKAFTDLLEKHVKLTNNKLE